jgi:hypothetical protein
VHHQHVRYNPVPKCVRKLQGSQLQLCYTPAAGVVGCCCPSSSCPMASTSCSVSNTHVCGSIQHTQQHQQKPAVAQRPVTAASDISGYLPARPGAFMPNCGDAATAAVLLLVLLAAAAPAVAVQSPTPAPLQRTPHVCGCIRCTDTHERPHNTSASYWRSLPFWA